MSCLFPVGAEAEAIVAGGNPGLINLAPGDGGRFGGIYPSRSKYTLTVAWYSTTFCSEIRPSSSVTRNQRR